MIDNDIKLHLHDTKNGIYNVSGLEIRKIENQFLFKINNVEVIIPIEKFEKICENMDGSITFEKQSFKMPKKQNRSSDIEVILKDKDGNESKTNIRSIHYNSTEHVELINHLRNVPDIISLGINNDKSEIVLIIQNEYDFRKSQEDSKHYTKEFRGYYKEDKFDDLKEIISHIMYNTNNNIYLHGKEFTLSTLDLQIDNDRIIDLENLGINRNDFNTFINDKENTFGHLFDRSHQRAIDIPKLCILEEQRCDFINKIQLLKEKKIKNDNIPLVFDKMGDFKFVKESEFTKENLEKLLDYAKDIDFDVRSSQSRGIITSMFYFANKNNLSELSTLILDRFEEFNNNTDRPRPFYLDDGYKCLRFCMVHENIDMIERLLTKYKGNQFDTDGVLFMDRLKDRNELMLFIENSSLNKELLERIIDKTNLSQYKEILLENKFDEELGI